jgi:Xaa-Pro aminopeptidase
MVAYADITPQDWHDELARRRAAVWEIVQQHECDAALIFGSALQDQPFRYLTNFVPIFGDSWGILYGADKLTSALNFNWQLDEARAASGLQDWHGIFNTPPLVAELLASHSPRKVGIVGLHRLPVTAYDTIKQALPNTEFVDIGAPVAVLRRVKSPLEIAMMREAGRVGDAAFDAIRQIIRPGMTEKEVAAHIGHAMLSEGADDFPVYPAAVVISGNDQPIPIRGSTSRKLEVGDSVMMDIGCTVQGYQTDITRTFVLGTPNAKQREVWDTVQRAYDAAFDQIRPGIPARELHRAAVQVIEGAGYALVHRIGHGLGLAASFEWPSLDTEPSPLFPGMVFCIEPGIYTPGAGCMKLEDDMVVTESGCELLTNCSREWIIPV